MIKKIISGCQDGTERAAIDVAIELEIPYGGWIPGNRRTTDGIIPDTYQLNEIADDDDGTELNVTDSDGTLILSHGKLSGKPALTAEFAIKHSRPCLHLDLKTLSAFDAARKIDRWIRENNIEILNVTGPLQTEAPDIYKTAFDIIEAVFYLNLIGTNRVDPLSYERESLRSDFPQTVDEAVETLISRMSLKEKTKIANTNEDKLDALSTTMGGYIRNTCRLSENEELMKSCCNMADEEQSGKHTVCQNFSQDDALLIIIRELWKKLQKTNVLRIVK